MSQPVLTQLSIPTLEVGQYAHPIVSVAATDNLYDQIIVTIALDRPLVLVDSSSSATITLGSHARNGYYSFTPLEVDLSAATPFGTYHVTGVTLANTAGETNSYTPDRLAAQGFTTSFLVDNPSYVQKWVAGALQGGGVSQLAFQNVNGTIATFETRNSPALNLVPLANDTAVDSSWHAIDTIDLAGSGTADILFRNTDGRLAIWYNAGIGQSYAGAPIQASSYTHAAVGNEWTIVGAADMTGDGKGDLLWRNDNGSISMWTSTGSGFTENTYFRANVGTNWRVEGVADFNGDRRADILWRNIDGSLSTWNATAGGFQENSSFHAPVDLSWHVVGLGDFTGDGRADILWHNDNGALSVWTSTGSGFVEGQFNAGASTSWQVAQVGDCNGDGLADIIWRNTTGQVSVWESTGSGWSQNVFSSDAANSSFNVIAHQFAL